MAFEVNLIKFLQSGLSTGWLSFFQVITLLGSWLGLFIAFIIIVRKRGIMAILLLLSFAFAGSFNFILKNLVCRPRPFETYDFIVNYGGESGYSMPSGHSVCVAVLTVFLIVYLFQNTKKTSVKVLGTVAIVLLALLVAFSRMVLGVHYLTDVIVGLLEGFVIASVILLIYNYRKLKNFIKVKD